MRTLWPHADELGIATDHQRERFAMATASAVGIVGGNPGAGKTHLSGQAIKCVAAHHGVDQIAVCAPTGKAAQRITEVMASHGVEGVEATTIHRLLGVSRNGHDQKGWGFMHNRSNPLPHRFIFVDESSMLGCGLGASLLDACQPGTHVLFIGDFAQLPPVEHGAPLRDMIAAGLPYGELTEVHRNGGDIVQACADVKAGKRYQPSPCINLELGHNLCHIEAGRPVDALGKLSELMRSVPAQFDPVWDVQVLCAVNDEKSSEVSRKRLNRGLQMILNPDGAQALGAGTAGRFRIGDKVICTTNGVLPIVQCDECNADGDAIGWDGKFYVCECSNAWKPADAATDFVANGEMGRVVMIEAGLIHVAFESPRRTVRVSGEWLQEFELAYAVTCWKAQGSQWPVVITMVDGSLATDRICSWEFHRTAWSRAQKLSISIGKRSDIDRQCRRSALRDRKTFLAELLGKDTAA